MHFPAICVKVWENEKQLYMSLKYVYYPHYIFVKRASHQGCTLVLVAISERKESKFHYSLIYLGNQ